MITALRIENFKCFSHLRLSLGSLTVLTGYNGGGKSSSTQPLLLLAQALRSEGEPRTFPLNGPLVRLGTAGDILPASGVASEVVLELEAEAESAEWHLMATAGDRSLTLDPSTATESPARESAANQARRYTASDIARAVASLTYLSAVREGTSLDAFPSPDCMNDVGSDGRFAPYHYDLLADEEVDERRRHPDQPASSFRMQVDAWLGSVFPGAQATVQELRAVGLFNLQFRIGIGPWLRPSNVGFGLSYAFPVVVALLSAKPGQLVLIDSPEAHLHPSAQSAMGGFIARCASAGVQVIVETHSDHLLNGVRLAVKNAILLSEQVAVHFFTGTKPSGAGVVAPIIDSEGRMSEWPVGFFDQAERDLSRLAGWDE